MSISGCVLSYIDKGNGQKRRKAYRKRASASAFIFAFPAIVNILMLDISAKICYIYINERFRSGIVFISHFRKDKLMKKVLSILIATLLVLFIVIPVTAADAVELTLDDNGYITCIKATASQDSYTIPYNEKQVRGIAPGCSFSGSIGTLKIPSGIFLSSNALSGCTSSNVVIEPGRYSLPSKLFYGNTHVVTISVPDSVASIGAACFSGCSKLISVSIPSEISEIPDSCFSGCSSLSGISIPSGVIKVGSSAFSGCANITTIDFSTNLKEIGDNAFADCLKLAQITTNRTVTFPTVTVIGSQAFYGTAINTLIIPDTVTTIGKGAFADCKQLTEVYIGDKVTDIPNSCFNRCESLYKVTFGKKVTRIGEYAFSYALSNDRYDADIILPANVTTIEKSAFEGCIGIATLSVYNSSCKINSNAFYRCSRFTMKGYNGSTAETFAKTASNVTFTSLTGGSTGDEEKYDDLRYTIIGGKVHITAYVGSGNDKVVVPAKIGGKDVTAIDANAFLRCDAVTVILPESIESISERAFAGCSKLRTIVILDKCRSIDSTAFNDTTSLTIRGLRNSYVQMYASDKNIAFSALSDSEYKCLSGTHGKTRTDRKEATCKEEGYERTICTVCGEVIKETKLPKPTSHTYETKTVAPTCTEKGYTLHTCKSCGDNYKDNETAALGHKWGEWYTLVKPTYTSTGTKTRHCTNSGCDESQTEVIPALTLNSFDEILEGMETEFEVITRYSDGETVKLFSGFDEKTDCSRYSDLFDPQYNIKLLGSNGFTKTSGYIATGDRFVLLDADGKIIDTLTVVVIGDVTGDGRVNAADYIAQRRVILGITNLSIASQTAADVNGNGKIQANDYIKLRRYILGMIDTLK